MYQPLRKGSNFLQGIVFLSLTLELELVSQLSSDLVFLLVSEQQMLLEFLPTNLITSMRLIIPSILEQWESLHVKLIQQPISLGLPLREPILNLSVKLYGVGFLISLGTRLIPFRLLSMVMHLKLD